MILDSGICSVFSVWDANGTGAAGNMPIKTYALFYQSWYGELSFETSPAYPTDGRNEKKTDARIRVIQNRNIKQNDVAVLEQINSFNQRTTQTYRITRVYHGQEDGMLISDLTLEVYEP